MVARKVTLSWIVVSDLKKAVKFFTETLGLKLHEMHEEFSWAELSGKDGEQRLGIAGMGMDGLKAGDNAVVTFSVDDIAKAKAELAERGVTMHGDILEVPGIVKLQTFSDSDGNLFQLVEDLEGHA